MSSTYADFLAPKPAGGWSELDQVESLNLLASEEHAARDRQRFEKEQRQQDRDAQHARDKLKRRERWSNFWGERKQRMVFILGFSLIALGLLLYFLIPRVPGVGWANEMSSTALTSTNTSGTYSTVPSHYDFSAQLALDIDARGSYIRTKMTDLRADVFDLDTGVSIGSGQRNGSISLAARDFTTVQLPLLFQGRFSNPNDTTYSDVIRACTTSNTVFPLTISFTFKIAGLVGTKAAKLQSQDLACPVALSLES